MTIQQHYRVVVDFQKKGVYPTLLLTESRARMETDNGSANPRISTATPENLRSLIGGPLMCIVFTK